ncbi:MAG: cytochrome c oxidase assembly protein [Sedimenticola sp.]|nr:MAG: cytochrome c oxidase assembly protein [Sedimenticola sp.]
MAGEQNLQSKNRRTLLMLSAITLGMFGFGFAMVPLYCFLCQITGVQSVQQRTQTTASTVAANQSVSDRWVTVKFDSTVHPDLPWNFQAQERKLRVRLGEVNEMDFIAENRSSSEILGQAIPSVVPWQANAFFNKMECFCFRQQSLKGLESKHMPLRFSVSPDLPNDISSLTISYNFMRLDMNNEKPFTVVAK